MSNLKDKKRLRLEREKDRLLKAVGRANENLFSDDLLRSLVEAKRIEGFEKLVRSLPYVVKMKLGYAEKAWRASVSTTKSPKVICTPMGNGSK